MVDIGHPRVPFREGPLPPDERRLDGVGSTEHVGMAQGEEEGPVAAHRLPGDAARARVRPCAIVRVDPGHQVVDQ